MKWPHVMLERMGAHFNDGLSAGQSARALNVEFGSALSRSAVIGMRNRHRMTGAPRILSDSPEAIKQRLRRRGPDTPDRVVRKRVANRLCCNP